MKAFFASIFRNKTKRWFIVTGVVVILLGAAGAVYFSRSAIPAGIQNPQAQTYRVQRGDLTTTITGTGKLISENVDSLAFSTEGIVDTLNVKAGQQVKKGELLASLKDTEELTLEVENAQLALQQAEKAVQDLKDSAEINLANAKAEMAEAGKAYEQAQKELITKGQPRCDKDTTETYYYDYMFAKHDYEMWHSYLIDGGTGYGTMYIQERMAPYKQSMLLNYANWKYCEGYTETEKKASEAALELAKANLEKAAAAYDELEKNGGVNLLEMEIAEAKRADAEQALSEAKANLADAALTAPFDGVITKVNGSPGDKYENGTFIEIADLENEVVQASVEETDILNFKAGCSAAVTFTTHKDQVYNGTVARVDPSLVSGFDTRVAQGWVKLTDPLPDEIKNYSLGLDASVVITCLQSKDVLLAPANAVYKSGGKSYVYVLGPNQEREKREVGVGHSSPTFIEITSGLNQGETIVIEQES